MNEPKKSRCPPCDIEKSDINVMSAFLLGAGLGIAWKGPASDLVDSFCERHHKEFVPTFLRAALAVNRAALAHDEKIAKGSS